jgi:hypothetical protein
MFAPIPVATAVDVLGLVGEFSLPEVLRKLAHREGSAEFTFLARVNRQSQTHCGPLGRNFVLVLVKGGELLFSANALTGSHTRSSAHSSQNSGPPSCTSVSIITYASSVVKAATPAYRFHGNLVLCLLTGDR